MMITSSTLQKKLYPRRSIFNLLSDKGEQFVVCERYRVLGLVCQSKGEAEKAINHFETALGIASSFNWHYQLFWTNHSLANLLFGEGRFDDAHAHVERAKSHAIDGAGSYCLGRAMELQADFGIRKTGLKRQSLRLCVLPTFMGRSGP